MEINKETLEKIQKIARALAPKYVFDCYDREDIEQEAILMGIDALSRYDKNRPLENFLYTHISNRLKNFKRDNYYRANPNGEPERIQQNKKNILDAGTLNEGTVFFEQNLDDIIDNKEVIERINQKLPASYRKDYLRLCANAHVPTKRKQELYSLIKEIVNEQS